LAERAGVSKTAPYRHFADREAFLGSLADEGFRLLCEALELVWSPADTAGSAAAADGTENADADKAAAVASAEGTRLVARMGRAYMDFAVGHPALYRLMNSPLICSLPEDSMRWARRSLLLLGKALASGHRTASTRSAGSDKATGAAGEPLGGDRLKTAAEASGMDIDAVAASWGYIHGLVLLRIDGLFPKDLPEPDWNRLASTMPLLP
jgi:AcrR family transcriptional regulator